jgi:hypothetical protein
MQPDGSESGNPVEVPAATAFEQLNTSGRRRTRSVSSELQRPWALLVRGFAICLSATYHADQSIKVQSKFARLNRMPLMGNPDSSSSAMPHLLRTTELNANTCRTKPDRY